ncbi:hypothetical protein B0H10DRAFT_1976937 [Mycena sp. CBHHK59/15]|nr:hypothetical protein B0H10DRAFT_1976937 [Mycena sp. CBHHK59/15]
MFFPASIAFTLLLSLSGIAVHGAPVVSREVVPQACTGTNGSGICLPLNVAPDNTSGNGPAINPAACTNVANSVRSLILNVDNDCVGFPNPDCELGDGVAQEIFSDASGDLPAGLLSFSCSQIDGLVNGLFP